MLLAGLRGFITGAGTGIGRAIALQRRALEFVTGMSIVAALTVGAVALASAHDVSVPDGGSWAIILALALGTGGFGHFLINWAHGHAPLVLTSLLTLLIPVVAMAGAALFLGEDVVAAQVVGAAVVLDYCAAVRGILNDDQGGPLTPPGLRMAAALREVRESLQRNLDAQKGGARTTT